MRVANRFATKSGLQLSSTRITAPPGTRISISGLRDGHRERMDRLSRQLFLPPIKAAKEQTDSLIDRPDWTEELLHLRKIFSPGLGCLALDAAIKGRLRKIPLNAIPTLTLSADLPGFNVFSPERLFSRVADPSLLRRIASYLIFGSLLHDSLDLRWLNHAPKLIEIHPTGQTQCMNRQLSGECETAPASHHFVVAPSQLMNDEFAVERRLFLFATSPHNAAGESPLRFPLIFPSLYFLKCRPPCHGSLRANGPHHRPHLVH